MLTGKPYQIMLKAILYQVVKFRDILYFNYGLNLTKGQSTIEKVSSIKARE